MLRRSTLFAAFALLFVALCGRASFADPQPEVYGVFPADGGGQTLWRAIDTDALGNTYAAGETFGDYESSTHVTQERELVFSIFAANGTRLCTALVQNPGSPTYNTFAYDTKSDEQGGAWVAFYDHSTGSLAWGDYTFPARSFADVDGGMAHFNSECERDKFVPTALMSSTYASDHDQFYGACRRARARCPLPDR